MAKIQFREVGGVYAAVHMIRSYYRATRTPYDPSTVRIDGKTLYADNLPDRLLENIVGRVEGGAKIKF